MANGNNGGGWVEERSGVTITGPDLGSFAGVVELAQEAIPGDLSAHTKSKWYQIKKYYQVDNVSRWRAWRRLRDQSGGQEIWLFYACPTSMIEAVLDHQEVLPYGDFFPRVFGQEAIYLFEQSTPAARAALKFGVEDEGYLLSCRMAASKVLRTRKGNPRASQLPAGYHAAMAPKGTDLGGGPTACDTYATFDPDRLLIRYVTHIAWNA
jgi:hypothetical protein